MKKLFLLLGLVAGAAFAQLSAPAAFYFGSPSSGIGGACGTVTYGYLTAAGQVVTCVSSVWTVSAGSSGGTVTTLSVATANGVSGSVANPTTTPAITFTLGAITPTSVNGITITTGTGTLTLAAGKTLTDTSGVGAVPLKGATGGGFAAASAADIIALGNLFTLTTTGSSGAATYSGGTLNIPQYSGGGSSAFSALTSATNTTATMVVGTGASLATSGSGAITATAIAVGGITGLGTGVGTALAAAVSGSGAICLASGSACGSGSSPAFSALTSATNTTAAMVVGSGATLGVSGTGTIAATSAPVAGITGFGTNVEAWLATPSGANLASALTSPVPLSVGGTNATSAAAGTIPNATSGTASSWTATPTLGTDNSIAGTLQLANGSANAHTILSSGATTTNTIQGFAAVPTTGHLLDCTVTGTTCLMHDSGVVTANVVNASSPGAGVAHFAGSTQTVTSSAVVNADIAASTIDLTAKVTGLLPQANISLVNLPTPGATCTFTAPATICVATTTATITVPVPAAGQQFCVMNDDNVSTVITLSAIGSSARYENTARTAYGTAGTGTFVSGGAVGDMVCIVGRDSTHYLTVSSKGTWVTN
jgi:fibronectin-binding autotransporter adhesin